MKSRTCTELSSHNSRSQHETQYNVRDSSENAQFAQCTTFFRGNGARTESRTFFEYGKCTGIHQKLPEIF